MSKPIKPIKLGVLISGSGTNLQAIIDRIAEGTLDATIELVVSSRPSAFGLKRAENAGDGREDPDGRGLHVVGGIVLLEDALEARRLGV